MARPIVLGLAGASEREIALVVPSGWRAAPYYWDSVPAYDTSIQFLRPCKYYSEVLRIAPVTAQRWWCWDQERRNLIAFAEATSFDVVAAQHPNWVWVIGNEPDLAEQDDMSPQAYAEFFGHVAMTLTKALRSRRSNAVPKLVFCQVSTPDKREYCEEAYFRLQQSWSSNRWPDWPKDVSVAEVIYAVAVHNYASSDHDCDAGRLCFGARLEEDRLEQTMAVWRHRLDEFVGWVNLLDGGALAKKPLWLTEYGVLAAFCPRALEVRRGRDPEHGVPCAHVAKRGNGRVDDDAIFYGRNDREGIWGLQRLALSYLLNPGERAGGNRGKWEAAWWFAGSIGWYERGECVATGWLLGDTVDCGREVDQLSPAGRTFRNTIECLTRGRGCSEPAADRAGRLYPKALARQPKV